MSVFDAHVGPACPGEPGTVALRRHEAVLVRTGDGGIWIGQVRRIGPDGQLGLKHPATVALDDRLAVVSAALPSIDRATTQPGWQEITYRRVGDVGMVTFDFYNGAMSTGQCRRLALALRTRPPTTQESWCSGVATCSPTASTST